MVVQSRIIEEESAHVASDEIDAKGRFSPYLFGEEWGN
jgi:hypothetical protein